MPLLKAEKVKLVEELAGLAKSHQTIGVISMQKAPAWLVANAKRALGSSAKVKVARKNLLLHALADAGKDGGFSTMISGSSALVFSNDNAFELFRKIKSAKANAPAKAGDVVQKDILVPKGPTQISPGPAITTLQKAGIKTRVEGGKIAVAEDKTVLKAGEQVTPDIAAALALLGIMPVEISLNMTVAWEGGIIYSCDILDINLEKFALDIAAGVQAAINFSLNTGFLTEESAIFAVQKAYLEAKVLALEANIVTEETAPALIAKAAREAAALEQVMQTPCAEEKKREGDAAQ